VRPIKPAFPITEAIADDEEGSGQGWWDAHISDVRAVGQERYG